MAFHVACPITCRRICFCKLGFPKDLQTDKSKSDFLLDVHRIQEFLKDPYGIRASNHTIQVSVPKVVPLIAPPLPQSAAGDDGGGPAEEEPPHPHTKRAALHKKAAAAMVAAADYARRFEAADVAVRDSNENVASTDVVREERGLSGSNIMCRMCFVGETEGSERARKMLSCKSCGKKYHRNCIKSWGKHRDLFHWSSWSCPSCRTCELCRRTGDPNKFMFCKRCDGAFHCYCQHPPHKNVSSGPWLCTNHTKCHSCGSNVPGNGLSVRWFLGYTCCDACGRLFVKGNYCPVCLKVYRDSESTPMVCCDICQRWVHCHCDGISDERYLQFQVDGDLQYKCPTCRGECYRVKDLEDAVQELWRRKDLEDRDLIASLRDAAGLPTEDDVFSISPYSDDEDNGPVTGKSEHGRSIKLSLKGLVDKSPKKSKEYGKKPSNKKNAKKKSFTGKTEMHQQEVDTYEHSLDDKKNENVESHIKGGPDLIAGTTNHSESVHSVNQPGGLKQKFVDEVMVNNEEKTPRVVKIKTSRPHDLHNGDDTENHSSKAKSLKTKKLVINLGPRKLNVTNSPKSDSSSCQREQDLKTSNGDAVDRSGSFKGLKFARREGNFIKFGKVKSEAAGVNPKSDQASDSDGHATIPLDHLRVSSRRTGGGSSTSVGPAGEVPTLRSDKISSGKHSEDRADAHTESNDDSSDMPILHSLPKDSKFSLKLKIKKPNLENQNSHISQPDEEKSSIRGQRSKRKRPSYLEKPSFNEDEDADVTHSLDSEMMEASWILKKLGRDAIGKRVEVHHPSDNSWRKGVVSDIVESTSMVSVSLDDGKVKKLELGKQAVRFVAQKQKR